MSIVLKAAVVSFLGICAGGGAAKADCQSDFQAMMAAHLKAGPYRVSSKGGARAYDIDVLAPDTFHIREYASGSLSSELVFTSQGGWVKVNAKWESIPNAAVEQSVAGFRAGLAGGFKNANELVCQGNQAPRELSNGKNVTGYYIFKIDLFDLHSGKQIPTSVGLLQGEDGRPGALLLRTRKGDEAQSITYDPTIKIERPTQ